MGFHRPLLGGAPPSFQNKQDSQKEPIFFNINDLLFENSSTVKQRRLFASALGGRWVDDAMGFKTGSGQIREIIDLFGDIGPSRPPSSSAKSWVPMARPASYLRISTRLGWLTSYPITPGSYSIFSRPANCVNAWILPLVSLKSP